MISRVSNQFLDWIRSLTSSWRSRSSALMRSRRGSAYSRQMPHRQSSPRFNLKAPHAGKIQVQVVLHLQTYWRQFIRVWRYLLKLFCHVLKLGWDEDVTRMRQLVIRNFVYVSASVQTVVMACLM